MKEFKNTQGSSLVLLYVNSNKESWKLGLIESNQDGGKYFCLRSSSHSPFTFRTQDGRNVHRAHSYMDVNS